MWTKEKAWGKTSHDGNIGWTQWIFIRHHYRCWSCIHRQAFNYAHTKKFMLDLSYLRRYSKLYVASACGLREIGLWQHFHWHTTHLHHVMFKPRLSLLSFCLLWCTHEQGSSGDEASKAYIYNTSSLVVSSFPDHSVENGLGTRLASQLSIIDVPSVVGGLPHSASEQTKRVLFKENLVQL